MRTFYIFYLLKLFFLDVEKYGKQLTLFLKFVTTSGASERDTYANKKQILSPVITQHRERDEM
jgi:hypothetical protein